MRRLDVAVDANMKTTIECAKCGKKYDEHNEVIAANHGDGLTCWCPECLRTNIVLPPSDHQIALRSTWPMYTKMAFWWVFGMALAYGFLYYGLGFIDAVLSKIFL